MAWALGNRILTAQIPDNDPQQLEAGVRAAHGCQAAGTDERSR